MQPPQSSSQRPSDAIRPGKRGTTARLDHNPAATAVARANQMINDTAHDIRSPLAGVRESIRSVHDGSAGTINADQREFLGSAIESCNAIDRLVDHLVQFDVQHSDSDAKVRQWMTIDRLMQTMGRSINAWAESRGVSIQLDPMVAASTQVYVDPHAITRLIANLVQNAARASRGGQSVLVRYAGGSTGDAVTWSVIDRGVGMSADDLGKAAGRGVSLSGGSGLGLSICQELAAAHHSVLRIRTRLGSGTQVQFQTASGGTASVAAAYARWRLAIRGPKAKPRRRDVSASNTSPTVRVDAGRAGSPSDLESTLELKVGQRRPIVSDRVMIGTIRVGAMVPSEVVPQIAEVMPRAIGHFDFVEAIDEHTFVYAIDETRQRFADRTDQIDTKVQRRLPLARLQWSEPQEAKIDEHRWVTRFTDLAVRCTLVTERREGSAGIIDESRLGVEPMGPSTVAAWRLEEEMRRLGHRMKNQNSAIRNQSRRLRSRG